MAKKLHDKYFKLAKREGHLARSYYKLEELHRRNRLFRRGGRVLDLGACPGSWLEFILSIIGEEGIACAVDRNPINKRFKGKVHFKMGNIEDVTENTFAHAAKAFDVIVSDMAPNTSGVKILDQGRSLLLCEAAFALAEKILAPGGHFVCKVLEGENFPHFRTRLTPMFSEIKTQKPDASRDESMETYLVCLGYGLPLKGKPPPPVDATPPKAFRRRRKK